MAGGLIFAIALGVAGVLFGVWAFRASPYGPALTFALGGMTLLAIAVLTYAYALHTACHGDYDFVHDPFGCTRPAEAHGMH